MEHQLIETADGSHTIYLPHLNETYHSLHGAISESVHVFILEGLNKSNTRQTPLRVLEMGFGTGLNALLTAQWAQSHKRHLYYCSIEAYPLPQTVWQQLNYPALLPTAATNWFNALHTAQWGQQLPITPYFTLHKINSTIEGALLNDLLFDVVFFDAFAPNKQQEVWHPTVLAKLKNHLVAGGMLVSYSATGNFTRNLKALGFRAERLPGPPGKKQMTRAWLQP